MSGHLGIKKKHTVVSSVISSGQDLNQISSKPNQVIPAAPLKLIPVIGKPFKHVIVDCVGPLPETKSGNQYILTVMCTATRYPEAVLLRSLKARAIVNALITRPGHVRTKR